ncbi:MAG: hypothetical protein IPH82_08955 [Chloroflexi bacterium]|nr:hypothetical protein [Chloroflexota bacterium]
MSQPVTAEGGLLQAQRWLESVRSLVQREGERDVARQLSDLTEMVKQWQEFLSTDIEPFVQQQFASIPNRIGSRFGETEGTPVDFG